MTLLSMDFESIASADSATLAFYNLGNKFNIDCVFLKQVL